ncbi:MAG: ABC transporter permease [Kineosporiaceae bacterium]
MAIRLRRIEFAQLLAIGVRRRQLERVIAAQTVLLWGVGALCGLVVGLFLTLPLRSLVAMAAPSGLPVPDVAIHLPWLQLLALLGTVALVLALVVAGVARTLRGSVLGSVLRLGDER